MSNAIVKKIQLEYLRVIEGHFTNDVRDFFNSGLNFNEYIKSGKLMTSSNLKLLSSGRLYDVGAYKAMNMYKDIKEFWNKNEQLLKDNLKKEDNLAISLWSDMEMDELPSKFGLYFDTIMIPDPFPFYISSKDIGDHTQSELIIQLCFNWAILAHELKSAIEAEVDRPLIVFYPQKYGLTKNMIHYGMDDHVSIMRSDANSVAIKFLQETFKVEVDSNTGEDFVEKLRGYGTDYLNKNINLTKIKGMTNWFIKNIENVLKAKHWDIDENFIKRLLSKSINLDDIDRIFNMIGGLFYLIRSREANCFDFHAENALSEMLWPSTITNYDIVSKKWVKPLGLDQESVVAYSFEKRFKWLSNVRIENWVSLREHGVMDDMRNIFRVNRNRLKRATVEDFDEIARDLEFNVIKIIEEYQKKTLSDLNEIKKKAKNSAISFGLSLGLGAASIAFPAILPLSISAALYGTIVGGTSLLDFVNQHLQGKKKIKNLPERPLAFLLTEYMRKSDV